MSLSLNRQQLFDDVLNARQELMRSLLFLSEAEATGLMLHEDWCARDVISHIAARECTAMAAINHLIEEGDPLFRDPIDDREFNVGAVEWRRDFTLAEVIEELDSTRSQLAKTARRLSNNDLTTPYEIGFSGQTQTVADLLAGLAEHDLLHAAHIWEWRAQAGLLRREAFRDFLMAERTALLDSLGGLMEEDIATIEVLGHWTIKQVMAHLLSWDEESLRTAENWTEERPWQQGALYDDDWNEVQVARLADLSVIDLADGLATHQRKLVQLLNRLEDRQLVAMAQAPWGERMSLLSFYYEMACHDATHTPAIRSLQASLAIR